MHNCATIAGSVSCSNCVHSKIWLAQGSAGFIGQAWKVVVSVLVVVVVVVVVVVSIVAVVGVMVEEVRLVSTLPQNPANGFKMPKFQVNPPNSNV